MFSELKLTHNLFYLLFLDKLSLPVGENKTIEINSCVLNYMWSPPMDIICPLTMYIIYYREIQADGNEADWLQVPITELNITSVDIRLKCDVEYEIAMSVKDEEKESVLSNFWRVKTKSPTTDMPSNNSFSGKPKFVRFTSIAQIEIFLTLHKNSAQNRRNILFHR